MIIINAACFINIITITTTMNYDDYSYDTDHDDDYDYFAACLVLLFQLVFHYYYSCYMLFDGPQGRYQILIACLCLSLIS